MTSSFGPDDRYLIISSDMHAGASLYGYRPYLEQAWLEEFDRWAASFVNPYEQFGEVLDQGTDLNWESEARTRFLDEQGVAGEVLFPNTVPPFCKIGFGLALNPPRTAAELELAWAGLRAHNRWLIDFCGLEPDRRRGLIQLLPNDIELVLAEIRATVASDVAGVIGGVLLPAVPPGFTGDIEPYFHPRYEPLWAICEDLGLPVHQHPGTGTPTNGFQAPANSLMQSLEIGTWTRRTLTHLIASGVLERHHELAVVWTEQFCHGYFLEDLQMMDLRVPGYQSVNRGNPTIADFTFLGCEQVDELSMAPSDYFRRNCYLGASLLRRQEVLRRYEFGIDRIMWGTDFPHQEGAGAHTLPALRTLFWDVPVEECRLMLGATAARVYRFDVAKLTPLAQRIGPKLSEVHDEPIGDRPPGSAFAFT